MYRRFLFLIACLMLINSRANAQTTDGQVANDFAYCAAIGATGKETVTGPAGQRYLGSVYTKYLWDMLVFDSPEGAKNRFAEALQRHANLTKATISPDELSAKIVATLKNCDAMHVANADKINAYQLPTGTNRNSTPSAQPGNTTPLEVMSMLGKPFHEDYNQDGRFVYNYQTATGSDVYLFDREKKLVRMRSYCDSLKGKCSQ